MQAKKPARAHSGTSDNLAPVLAAAEFADASGRDLLASLAAAYHVQYRLTGSGVPIMRAGFDHTIQLAISSAAGMARALGLTPEKAAHAIALCAPGDLSVPVPEPVLQRIVEPVADLENHKAHDLVMVLHNTRHEPEASP